MPVVYFKRFKMQIDLPCKKPERTQALDVNIRFVPWSEAYLGMHSLAKWEAFRNELDANVFPCLGNRDGCRQLMRDLTLKSNFIPESTWLALCKLEDGVLEEPAGTIQGLRLSSREGAIQNIAVVPKWRGRGIGHELIARSLAGFESVGCKFVNLEVTMHNTAAIRLYESLGFEKIETVFKIGNVPMNLSKA